MKEPKLSNEGTLSSNLMTNIWKQEMIKYVDFVFQWRFVTKST